MSQRAKPKNAQKTQIDITGMTCITCATTIEKGLSETSGVEQVDVNLATEKATVEYDTVKYT